MRRAFSVLLFGLVTAALFLVPAGRAAADDDHPSWQITKYAVAANIDADGGVTQVRIDLDFDFGRDPGHGPYVTLPLRQRIADDPDHWRALDVTLGQVSSSSGANATVLTTEEDGNLLIRVGAEGSTYTGVQSYTITYTIRGLIAPNQAQSGLDEFNWNVIGDAWEVPIGNVSAAVTGPVAVSRVACWTGYGYDYSCQSATSDGTTATFQHTYLGEGDPLQIVAGFPAGTFTNAEPRFTTRYHLGNMVPVTPVTGGVTAALTALGLGFLLRRTRRGARDQVYLGLTPGVTPAPGQEAMVGYGNADVPVAVAFTPPAQARPGELGVLTDAIADNKDITATMIDLATRGYLHIEQTGRKDWTLTRKSSSEGLVGYEKKLFNGLFEKGSTVETDDLKKSSYSGLMEDTRSSLYKRVSTDLHWFTSNPRLVRGLAMAGGIGLVFVGILLGFGLGWAGIALGWGGFGLVGLAAVITGVAVMVLSSRFGSRTPTGSAVLAQTRGFELYLSTAEADQIKFEEGIDVFSRYLPYAIIFGVAERWTKVFQELEAQGRYTADHSWYVGYHSGAFLSPDFSSSMDALASKMSSNLQSATAASSGGSGFSGGGGFGGGGGGGW